MQHLLLGLAIAFAPSFPVLKGNELLDACASSSPFSRGHCMGYIEALLDDYTRYQEEPLTTFCVPAGATLRQTVDVVVKFLRESPELRDLAASDLIGVALHKAWPCR
jgi:hypothetical protein